MGQHNKHGLGRQVTGGFLWVLAQSVTTRMVGIVGQIVLAWLLTPADFGLVGLALTMAAFAELFQRAGVGEVLVHRQRKIGLWISPAFWMSLCAGVLVALGMVAVAPGIAWFYAEPKLVGMLWILAATVPISSASTIPKAILQIDLRFRFLAKLGAIESVGQMVLTILFAWMGLGAYSFVLPRPVVAIMNLAITWVAASPSLQCRPRISRWKYILSDGLPMLLGSVVITAMAQGDYILLGAMYSAEVVGLYFFSFNLSMQLVQMLTANIARVLFPSLAKISSATEQTSFFMRICEIIAMVGVPAALLQSALAGPAIRLIFSDSWHGAIPLVQILSVAAAFRVILAGGGSLLQAQGRFTLRLILFSCYAPFFFMALYLGAAWRGALGVAVSVTCYYSVLGVFHLWLVVRPGGGTLRDAWQIYLMPLLGGGLSVASGCLLSRFLPDTHYRDFYEMIVVAFVALLLYCLFCVLFLPSRCAAMARQIQGLLRR